MKVRAASIALLAAAALASCDHSTSPPAVVAPVDASPVDGSVGVAFPASRCPSGYAHPNTCCLGSPGGQPVCEHFSSPFVPCPEGWYLYPDVYNCCALAELDRCVSTPVITGALPDGSRPPTACFYPCGPGAFPMSVYLEVRGEPTPPDGAICCGASLDVNMPPSMMSTAGSACVTATCQPQVFGPCGPVCDPCPTGWAVPPGGQLDVCCQTGSAQSACFSQAQQIL